MDSTIAGSVCTAYFNFVRTDARDRSRVGGLTFGYIRPRGGRAERVPARGAARRPSQRRGVQGRTKRQKAIGRRTATRCACRRFA
ncbi:hypothetical protein GPJ57_24955 [Burkholderia pseudomallei]|nr:hypothetical protein [Burkholderia pseudomallei]MWA29183.1 hypothetical protein [Burkholderia pseudomallei]